MSFTYEFMGQQVSLAVDEDVVAVRYKEPAVHSMRAAVAARAGLGPFQQRYEVPDEKFTIVPIAPTPQPRAQRHAASVQALKAAPEVARVAPVFKMGDRRVLATDRVLVGFKAKTAQPQEVLQRLYGTVLEARDREYLVQLPEEACPFEAAAKLAALHEVEYAEPDFVTLGKHIAQFLPQPISLPPVAAASGDVLLGQQYAVKITKAVEAWNLQIGDPAIKIAVLDEGTDTNHEDLKTTVVSAFDGIDNDTFQEPNPWDGHGTACAGLAAAVPNNDRGIRGVGGGCSLAW
jgi:thermitase